MAVLYITSLSSRSGKTMLAAGLGRNWLDSGKRVGYLKLMMPGQSGPDKEALFIQTLLGLKEPVEDLTIVTDEPGTPISPSLIARMQDKDIFIVEGLPLKLSAAIINKLDAKVLVVHDYALSLGEALPEYKKLTFNPAGVVLNKLAGVVLNKAPRNKLDRLTKAFKAELSGAGITFLGTIPEDRVLMSPSIGDLAEALNGKIVNNAEKSSELIENIMMGSSTFDRGAAYYNRKNNKAVILWGERPGFRKAAVSNLQLAALQTSTRSLVISSGATPIPAVVQKADEKKVPVISAPGSVPDLVNALEKSMPNLKFTQEQKMPRLLEILRLNLDLANLAQRLS